MRVLQFLLLLSVVLFSVVSVVQAAVTLRGQVDLSQKYLYEGKKENTAVVEYKDGVVDFKSSKAPKVIVFYSPYCGHCINYAPRYMQLAKDVTARYPQVEFYGVSCKVHRNVCGQYTIKGYPTIHVFKANSDNDSSSTVLNSRETTQERLIDVLELDKQQPVTIVETALDRKLDLATASDQDSDGDDEGQEEEDDGDESGEKESDEEDATEEDDDVEDEDRDPENAELDDAEDEDIDTADEGGKASDNASDNSAAAKDDAEEEEEDAEENVGLMLPVGEKVAITADLDEDGADAEDGKDDEDGVEDGVEEDDVEADRDESESDADEEDGVIDMKDLAPPVADEEEDSVPDTEDESDAADKSATGRVPSERDDEDESEDADEDEETTIDEDEEESPEDLARLHDPPRGGKHIFEAEREGDAPLLGAGAQKSKTVARDMDKWKEEIAQKLEKYRKKRGRLGRRKKGEQGQAGQLTDKNGATNIMKAHTPGTAEYKERMDKLLKKINKLRHKRGLPPLKRSFVGAKNSQLPVKKEVKKPRLPEKVPVVKKLFKMSEEEQLILDASLSFMAGLKYGVFMSDDSLTNKQKAALKGWLDLMSVSLPPEWGLHSLIDELNDNIDWVSQSNENLLKILRKHPLPRRNWSPSCMKRDSPQGFSCGMWKLLHTSTVGIAEQRGGLNLAQPGEPDSGPPRIFSPADAADTIREYLAHFFGCIECRNHFIAQYDQCSFRRCVRLAEDASLATAEDWKQLALWLWEVHNDVSVRVANERIEREMESKKRKANRFQMAKRKRIDEIKHLYPSLEQCLQCFDDSGRWDEDNVFEFLEATYWSKPDATADKLLQYRGEEGSGSGFFWFIVILVLAVVYILRGRNVDGLQRTVNAAMVTGRKSMRGTKKRSV